MAGFSTLDLSSGELSLLTNGFREMVAFEDEAVGFTGFGSFVLVAALVTRGGGAATSACTLFLLEERVTVRGLLAMWSDLRTLLCYIRKLAHERTGRDVPIRKS